MIDATAARVRQNLSARLVGPGGAENAPAATLAQLNQYFDGGAARGATLGAPKVPSGASAAPAPRVPAVLGAGVTSDLEAPAPPAPAPITIPDDPDARAQRNYFARGAAAGVQRLKDDATVQMWHAFGLTQTVGDPAGKAQYIVRQVNGTCGIGAQYEALRARGFHVDMPDLTRTAEDKGWYVEYRSADGTGGSTVGGNIAALMTLHGVAANVVLNGATDAQLQNGIRASGDAIVVVNAKVLWADKNLPDSSPHEIYVSGMEVDRSGVVRGYYINDTGEDEAARYVPAQTFDQAWLHELVTFPPRAAAASVGGAGH
jgi:hypothetical protein